MDWLGSILGGGGLSAGMASGAFGPNAGGPVVVNVAGFGSKASGNATSAATPAAETVPAGQSAAAGLPSWLLPAVGLAVAVAAVLAARRKG